MRREVKDRMYRTFTYQDVDRIPDEEFGYWPQTIRRWIGEGMKAELTKDEQNQMFPAKLDEFFGIERGVAVGGGINFNMIPAFETEIIERRERSVIMRDASGCTAERFTDDQEESSIPHYLDFPVKTPDDWREMKQRYRIDDEARQCTQDTIDHLREGAEEGKMVCFNCPGAYGMLRNWMGFENLSVAFYEYPNMIHDMVEHMTELSVHQIRQLPGDLPIDYSGWWEDMAGRNGPFVSPKMFAEFLQPQYHAIQNELKKHGLVIGMVDSDGNPHDIVGNWLEEGVNIMFPLEVAAGVDARAWREEFGMELRLKGGIDKRAVAVGPGAIDAELERIKPLLESGGYVPHLDHLVPPDVSYDNYRYYLEKKKRLIGK